MAPKQDDLFSSSALVLPSLAPTTNMVPFEPSRELSKAERKVREEAHKQSLVIQEQAQKTREVNRAIGQLRVEGMQLFTECAESIWAVKSASGRDPVLQGYVDQFADRSIRDCAMDIYTATGIGVSRITEEGGRSLYITTEEERHGWLARQMIGER